MAIDSVRRPGSSPTSSKPPAPESSTLKVGARGEPVAALQRLLVSKGYNIGTPDGIFGPKTQAAVANFQRAQGLKPDGIVGPRTWEALRSGGTGTRTTDNFSSTGNRTTDTSRLGEGTNTRVPQTQPQQPQTTPQQPQAQTTPQQPRPQTPTTTTPATTQPAANPRLEAARKLVDARGTATAADAEAVARTMQNLPVSILEAAQRSGLRVVACRETVTDHMTELKGVRPRGWPPGATWDQVPGLYNPANGQVVVATIESRGQRVVPAQGQGHGSFDITLHELGHGLDAKESLGGRDAGDDDFRRAYDADLPNLRAQNETYLLQEGSAGREEAFAETFARYFARDPSLQRDLPGMYAYWQTVEAALTRR